MHPIFQIEEVLCEVFGWLSSPAPILSLALTCRMLRDIGLTEVWKHGDVLSLVMAIPEQYRCVVDGFDYKPVKHIELSSVPRPRGWMGPRFSLYAQSIRDIYIQEDRFSFSYKPFISPAILEAWAFYEPGKPTFPNLRALQISWMSRYADLIRELSQGSLRTLYIRVYHDPVPHSPEYDYLMNHLPVKCNSLDDLGLSINQNQGPAEDLINLSTNNPAPFMPPLHQFRCLRGLKVHQRVSTELFRVIATLPFLCNLFMNYPASTSTISGASGTFPALTILSLYYGSLPTATFILNQVTSPHLKHVTVTICGFSHHTAQLFIPFARALRQFPNLELIHIKYRAARERDPAHMPVATSIRELCEPLLSLSNLRVLRLKLGQGCYGNDDIMLDMAMAWPLLKSIALAVLASQFNVSLATLSVVLRVCPLLHTFGVPVDICRPIPPGALSGSSNPEIKCLHIVPLYAVLERHDIIRIGQSIKQLCPNVECQEVWMYDTMAHPEHRSITNLNLFLKTGELLAPETAPVSDN